MDSSEVAAIRFSRRSLIHGSLATLLAGAAGCTSPTRDDPESAVSVIRFGAVGGNDDTLPFRRAIAHARANGLDVRVPTGQWRVGSLVIPSGVTLRGEPGAALIPARPLAVWLTTAAAAAGAGIADVELRSQGQVRSAILRLSPGTRDFTASRVRFVGHLDRGVIGLETRADCVGVTLDDCDFQRVQTSIFLNHGPSDVVIERCRLSEWRERGIWIRGTATHAAHWVRIADTVIQPPAPGGRVRQPIQITGSDLMPMTRIAILRNTVRGNGRDYRDPARPGPADLISLHRCQDFEVSDNHCLDGGEVGITVARQCSDGRVERNVCARNGSAGISIGSAQSSYVENILVRDNVCVDNGRSQPGDTTPARARTGINVYNGRSITLSGNRCGNESSRDQLYGVAITASEVELLGNRLAGNTSAPRYNG